MTLLYFIIILILTLIIWLVVRKKWKAVLWTLGSLIVLAIAGWYLFLWFVSAAFQNKCETERTWKIEDYEIVEKRCIGFAGPPWYPIYLYQDNKEIDYVNSTSDSCLVKFTNELGDTLEFDLCDEELKRKKK